ncbi:MAG: adenylate kinase [Verrucomicrobia bacterium]|nr:adenylate kinase [Verrucomicrobiota bacterium]MBS0636480.1 adenylate kinase [Verrucomicrobiota bacterium]
MSQPAFSSPVIILLGPPGSGKGTQAVRISQKLAIPHISTGDIFRYNIKNATPLGLKVKEYLDAGKLVPDSVTLEMLFDRLNKDDCKNGYLLDGVPRTVAQAEAIQEYLKAHPHKLLVCNLVVSDAEILKRITGRRSCTACNKIYHIESAPPMQKETCDICKGPLTQRTDDTPAVVEERLKAYYSQTKPVEDFYKKVSQVHDVDGAQSSDQVFNSLLKILSPSA